MFKKYINAFTILSILILFLTGCASQSTPLANDPYDPTTMSTLTPESTDQPAVVSSSDSGDHSDGFRVKSISLITSPATIYHVTCGSPITISYLVNFTLEGNTAGGTIDFEYSTNQWETVTTGSITVEPGATSVSYSFFSTEIAMDGMSPLYSGMIRLVSPNQMISNIGKATGTCQPAIIW